MTMKADRGELCGDSAGKVMKLYSPLEVIYDRWDARSPETVFASPEKALGEFALAEEAREIQASPYASGKSSGRKR
ncbi:MAG: hypothetical protein LBK56_12290 [Gracilibacteraceae bacterium]|jgi:hypothetical protein|nr:hypothetical protein [Gracilibacteraceae bacterium]